MIGDLISILFLVIIWIKILKIKKSDFSRFLLEITIYFFAFIVTLLGYKLFFGINRFFFPEELFPSIVGVFASTLVLIYILFKFAILLINKKRPAWEIESKIYAIPVKALDFINPTDQDFQKFFMIFMAINLIIAGALFNSLADAFSVKKKLYVDRGFQDSLIVKERRLIDQMPKNENLKYNVAKAVEFIRLTNPYYYQQIIDNTDRIGIGSEGGPLACASSFDYSITFNPKYAKARYDSIKEYLALGAIIVHESQHLKDLRLVSGKNGFSFSAYIGGGAYFKIICNPITNYENFLYVFRVTSASFDEWCAQIEEVKFMRMYNVDYKNDPEIIELFRR
ncbi:MAG: hypothetical protein V1732_04485 [Patescibacteria group bacterium]